MPAPASVSASSTSASSSTAACSLLPSSSLPSLDATLEELIDLSQRAKEIEARRQVLTPILDQLVEEGLAEEQIAWGDYKITRRQRKSHTYPEHILQQRQQLKAAEQLSVALGETEVKITNFWEVR